jgi:hypothetical protein
MCPRRFAGSTYHLDDMDISLSGTGHNIDTHYLPPKDVADRLVYRYFHTVHPLVPIISKPEFDSVYQSLYSNDISAFDNYWLMITNLVFACASRSGESVGLEMCYSHLACFKRVRVHGALDGGTLFGIAVLKDMQALGLMGVYLLGCKQTNRLVQSFPRCAVVAVVAVVAFACPLDCEAK